MIQCPNCKSLVDARGNSACPKCFASLSPQPPPSPPQAPGVAPPAPTLGTPTQAVRTNARVSLTGEVLEDAPVSRSAATSAYGNAQPMTAPLPPRAMPSAYGKRETQPDNSDRKALFINLTVIFVLLALCGGGGYWKWMHRTNPKDQVTRYVHAIQWLDWGVVWDLSATPPGGKHRYDFISNMKDKFDNNGVLNIVARHTMEKIPFTIGEPTITGNEATVPVTRGATALDPAKSMQLTLTNYGGVWKIHPPSANPLEMMGDENAIKPGNGQLPSITPGMGGIPIIR